jgi:tetratricopeptide (TPR) repeat protein
MRDSIAGVSLTRLRPPSPGGEGTRDKIKTVFALASLILALCLTVILATACTRRLPGTAGTTSSATKTEAIRSNNLGVAEMNRGRPNEALTLFRRAIRDDSSFFAARLNEGIALLNTQRFEDAREVLLDSTRREPTSARAWYNLGILYRNLAQVDPAIDAFEHVARIDPDDADALYFLGQLQAQASRFDLAITWYERCLALDPLHLSAEFGLARAYQLSGNETAARQHLDRFDQLTKSGVAKPISLVYGEQGSILDGRARRRSRPRARRVRCSFCSRIGGFSPSIRAAGYRGAAKHLARARIWRLFH